MTCWLQAIKDALALSHGRLLVGSVRFGAVGESSSPLRSPPLCAGRWVLLLEEEEESCSGMASRQACWLAWAQTSPTGCGA